MFTVHPSMKPGAIIGYRKNGTPIRLIAGGAPEGDESSTSSGEGAGATGGDQSTQTDPPSGSTGTGGQGESAGSDQQQGRSDGGASPPAEGNAMRAVRDEAKQARQQARDAQAKLDQLQAAFDKQAEDTKARNLAFAKALGLAVDEPPDPAQLARDLAAAREQLQADTAKAQARERELTIELHLMRQAGRHGADPVMLADSKAFAAKLAKLDPGADDFGDELGELIKAHLEANPIYRATGSASAPAGDSGTRAGAGAGVTGGDGGGAGSAPRTRPAKEGTTAPPVRSGTDGGHNGAPGGNRQWTIDDVNKATPAEVDKAIDDGLLVDLGFNPRKKRR